MINFNFELRPELRRPRPQPLTQAAIDAVSIDRGRFFAHRAQISTTVDNTYWKRYRELPSSPRINPWFCLTVIVICLYGLWRLL